MKNKKPTKSKLSVLTQVCNLIPAGLVPKLAREHGVDVKARTFTAWSHVVSLLYAQLVHAIGLNDVCDGLRHHVGKLLPIRGAVPPSRNGLSHANRVRNSDMMEALFWQTLSHLQHRSPRFGPAGRYAGLPRRFKRTIHAIDSTTIQLVANCMDWAKHRRRKAAAKCHLRLNLQSFLPGFAVIEEASHHDDKRARALCAGLMEGEIVLFDKAYIEFRHLFELTLRGIFWVSRAKENMSYRVKRRLLKKPKGNILRDDLIVLSVAKSKKDYPQVLRRVEAMVEIDGKLVKMAFITNNLEWAASSICDLYRCRWAIEVFFKQIKQTLKVCDFLGHNKNAIRWQLWSALLLYVLLRYLAFLSSWPHSFTRLFAIVRGVVWDRLDLLKLLLFYGTASGSYRMRAAPETAYLPGLEPPRHGTAI